MIKPLLRFYFFLHKKNAIAKINVIVIWLFLVTNLYGFLIFPYFADIFIVYDSKTEKVNFSIYLNKFFKILGGYITFEKLKVFLHISENKALVFDVSDIKFRGTLKNFLSLEFLQIKNSLVLSQNEPINAIKGGLVQVFTSTLFPAIKSYKDFMELESTTTIWEQDRNMNLLKVTACFNILTLIIMFFRMKIKGKNKNEQSN